MKPKKQAFLTSDLEGSHVASMLKTLARLHDSLRYLGIDDKFDHGLEIPPLWPVEKCYWRIRREIREA